MKRITINDLRQEVAEYTNLLRKYGVIQSSTQLHILRGNFNGREWEASKPARYRIEGGGTGQSLRPLYGVACELGTTAAESVRMIREHMRVLETGMATAGLCGWEITFVTQAGTARFISGTAPRHMTPEQKSKWALDTLRYRFEIPNLDRVRIASIREL